MAQTPAKQGKAGQKEMQLSPPAAFTPNTSPGAAHSHRQSWICPSPGSSPMWEELFQCPTGGDELYRQLNPCAPSLCPGWSCGAPEAPCVFFTGPASSQVTAIAFPSPTGLAWLPVPICGKPDEETETAERSSLFRSVHKQLHQRGATRGNKGLETQGWRSQNPGMFWVGKDLELFWQCCAQKQRDSEATG